MLLVSLILIGCWIQAVLVQDAAATDEPTTPLAEITLVPTDNPLISVEPTQPLATPIPAQPTLETTLLAPSLIAPSEVTLVVTLPPPAILPVEATLPPPPLVSTPTPSQPPSTSASITIVPSALRVPQNSVISLWFVGEGLANVSIVAITCQSDPTRLFGTQALPGTWFSADQVIVTDRGFQADGQWVLTAVLPGSAGEFSSSGDLWSLNYQMIASGLTQIVCDISVFDRGGEPIPLMAAETTLTFEGYQDVAVILPTVEAPAEIPILPTLEATPEVSPTVGDSPAPEATQDSTAVPPTPETTQDFGQVATVEVTAEISPTEVVPMLESTQDATASEPTLESTAEVNPTMDDAAALEVTEVPTAPDTETVLSNLSGSINVSEPLMEAVVTITGVDGQQTVAVQADGSFFVDIPPGHYEIVFSAPQHLSYTLVGLIPEQPVVLAPIKLIGGDADGNGVVDAADVALVLENFGRTVPPAAVAADLNGDRVVNIFDLVLVSANAGAGN